MAVDMANALEALRLRKGGKLVYVREGVEIHQPGRPVLLLTHAAAQDFNNMIEEAHHAG
jgi:hypothetical protein